MKAADTDVIPSTSGPIAARPASQSDIGYSADLTVVTYIIRKYLFTLAVIVLALVLLPAGVAMVPLRDVIPSAFLWGGFATAIYIWWDFDRRNLWALTDNLRLPRHVLIACFLTFSTVLSIVIKSWIR